MTRSVSYGPSITFSFGSNILHDVTDPASLQDAATKNYVDTHTSSGASVTFASPSLTLSTTNLSGAASTVIASNSQLAVFNLLGPVAQAFGDTSLTGSAAFAARQDHRHPMPATPVTSIQKTGSAAITGSMTLSAGSGVSLTQSGSDISIAAAGAGGATEYDYVEITSVVTTSSSVDAITGNAVTYDGSTRILIEVVCPYVSNVVAGASALLNLYEGSTDLGKLTEVYSSSGQITSAVHECRFLTPSAGSHTYKIKLVHANTAATVSIAAGAGGTGNFMPAYMRITKA